MGDCPLRLAGRCVAASARAYTSATVQTSLGHALIERPADNPGFTVVAFRGSTTIGDWVSNFDLHRVGSPPVHQGFQAAATSLWAQLVPDEDQPLVLTGHSRGGAIALLAAYHFARAGRMVLAVVTFGGPRVGGRDWCRAYEPLLGRLTYRFVHEEDPVPCLPSCLFGWRHVGNEIYLPSIGGALVNPRWWQKSARELRGLVREWYQGRWALVADHTVDQYREHIRGMIEAKAEKLKS